MKFAHFFIDRPIFAAVLSIVITLAGAISMQLLPISEYPEVAPPSVVVAAAYPGASPAVVAETVAAPLEQAINGVENMLYMSSGSSSSGSMQLTVTFKSGTDPDQAQVQVQNRVAQALTKLPEDVRRIGVTTVKSNSDITLFVQLISPSKRYDLKYLRNYAELQVRDTLARIPGMGQVEVFGGGSYAMRLWLDPQRIAARNMTAGDVVQAVREQNVQVAAGVVGAQPMPAGVDQQLLVNAYGRLASEEEFGEIIVKTGANGEVTRLKDVARIELGTQDYCIVGYLDKNPAVAIAIFQAPGSNALQLSTDVKAAMDDMARNFPEGLEYRVIYDPTNFVRHSITAVIETLVEALILVVLVVVLFLQSWRASIIPLAAVPVSIIGTFAVLLMAGFSINTLSLFGLVLAIGIVVDDAIVVVENVERNIEAGLSPRDATFKAMDEVSGPIIAIALVLTAVFIPIAFIGGLTGEFYRQFAVTIAISTLISAFNSLTLSPALAAVLLKPHGGKPDFATRVIDKGAGWIFRPFNRFFHRASESYGRGVGRVIRVSGLAVLVYAGLLALGALGFMRVPQGFVPVQDKDYVIAFAQLPDASSLNRTEEVIRRMSDIFVAEEGVESVIAFSGMNVQSGFGVASNAGVIFAVLDPASKRGKGLSAQEIQQSLQGKMFGIEAAFIGVVMPPPVMGMGTLGGFAMRIEDRSSLGYQGLNRVLQEFLAKANQTPGVAGVFSTYLVNVPQIYADIDRVKAKRDDVPLANVFDALQTYLGSMYVNDLNLFGRSYQVVAQADAPFRARKEQILDLKTRNAKGDMVPLGSVMTVRDSVGPDSVSHYNGFLSADVSGQAAPGTSSTGALEALEKLARDTLPAGVAFEWTDLSYQEVLSRGSSTLIFPLCVLLAFLVLAAQYESWTLPLAVILIV
ncbi:MAG: efflux RND transporter permease subunit, partial [Proteobacteria bacterium]